MQAATSMKLCSYGGCGRIVTRAEGRCPEHERAERQRRDAKVKAYGYRSPHWKRIRRERLELAGYHCELRLPGCTEAATHVHLDPAYRGMHHAAFVDDTRACCACCSGAIDAPRSQQR